MDVNSSKNSPKAKKSKSRLQSCNIRFKPARAVPVFLAVIILIPAVVFSLPSCRLPDLTFGEIVISGSISSQTGEPEDPGNRFDTNTKQIYASISYSGVKGNDTWRFKWINTSLGKTIMDSEKKFSDQNPESYFEGIVSSSISITDESKILSPGAYRVEFYFNDELKNNASFEITNPDMHILKVEFAASIDSMGKPLEATLQFRQGEKVYVSVELDYLISGNSLKAVWKNEKGELLDEEEINIDENYYSRSYKWFAVILDEGSGLASPGKYKVEILLNGTLSSSAEFEVIEKEPVTFKSGMRYSNLEYNFSFSIPDGWSYEEQIDENITTVTLSPDREIEAAFLFSATDAESVKPFEDFAKADADKQAQQNGWTFLDSRWRDYNLQNRYPTRELMYLYRDAQGMNYALAYSISEYNENAYILNIVVEDKTYGELAQKVYEGILNSLMIQ